MKIKDITQVLEEHAPLSLQESYDNAGLLVGDPEAEVTGVLLTLDVTEAVLAEAEKKSCNLVVSHHPLIFKPLRRITGANLTERMVIAAIRKDIAVYACHTNLDSVYHGVSTALAQKLGLKEISILQPGKGLLKKLVTFCPSDHVERLRQALFDAGAGKIGNYDSCSYNILGQGSFRALEGAEPFAGEINRLHFEEEIRIETIFPVYKQSQVLKALLDAHPYEEVAYDVYPLDKEYEKVGMGVTGMLDKEMPEMDFLKFLKETTACPAVRHSPLLNRNIRKIALCGGAGSFLIREAIRQKAAVFITGDLKYHDFFEAEQKILLADIGHYESEQYAKSLLYSIISEKFPNFAVLISEISTNPISSL